MGDGVGDGCVGCVVGVAGCDGCVAWGAGENDRWGR